VGRGVAPFPLKCTPLACAVGDEAVSDARRLYIVHGRLVHADSG